MNRLPRILGYVLITLVVIGCMAAFIYGGRPRPAPGAQIEIVLA